MSETPVDTCHVCGSLCVVRKIRALVAPMIYGDVDKLESLLPRIQKSFFWMFTDIKHRALEERPGYQSPELAEAKQLFDLLNEVYGK